MRPWLLSLGLEAPEDALSIRLAVAAVVEPVGGFVEAADWLNDRGNRKTYAEGIFRGFEPEGE